ncbi:MAG: alpha/beta hydrolase-fold protein [Cyclobacteriaceae bacterium]
MKRLVLLLITCSILSFTNAQDYTPFQKRVNALTSLGKLTDSDQQREAQRVLIDSLKRADQIPITYKDSVAFIFAGQATSVDWMGDFNGWGYDKNFANAGKQIPGTNIWLLKASFPEDARLDYKIVLNKKAWILDPLNLNQQWSGVGGGSPNSELRMPGYHDEPYQKERSDIPKGTVDRDILFTSHMLGYQITYSVYMPPNASGKLPVVYVTDGYEYLHPQLGNMPVVLDNLIADKKITPIMAVFIDHREPANRTNNRRMQELVMNENYLKFFVDEFIPYIELTYPAATERSKRAVIGSSVGGLSATYFAFSRPDVFGNAGIQSPSFFTRPQIYSLCDSPEGSKLKISMTSGVINDASDGGRRMIKILENNSCVYQYREVNQGHSWGNWKDLVDDILVDFFAAQP